MTGFGTKLAIGSCGGLTLACLLGVGLANFTESGAFAFYKQPRMAAWAPVQVAEAAPAPETVYPGSYGLYTVTPRSQVDAIYPIRDMVEFEPDPVEPAREAIARIPLPEPAAEQPREPAQPATPSEADAPSTAGPWVTAEEEAAPPEAPAEPVSTIY